MCFCLCVNREKEHSLIRYQALPGAHTSGAVIVYCSIPSTFNLLLCSLSLFLTPISIFHHPSSWLFPVSLSLSIFTPSFPLLQSRLPLQWRGKRQWEGGVGGVVRGAQRDWEREVRDEERAVWYWLSVALLALVDLIWADYRNTIPTNHRSASWASHPVTRTQTQHIKARSHTHKHTLPRVDTHTCGLSSRCSLTPNISYSPNTWVHTSFTTPLPSLTRCITHAARHNYLLTNNY